jgi:hypothetical protein
MNFKVVLALILTPLGFLLFPGGVAISQQGPPVTDASPVNDFEIVFPTPTDSEKGDYLLLSSEDQARLLSVLEHMKAVWADPGFRDQVLHKQFQSYRGSDVTSLVIWKNITAPHPKVLTLYLCTDEKETTATASTGPLTQKTCLFPKYLHDPATTLNVLVNTLSHEYTHTKQAGLYKHSPVSKCWHGMGIGCNRENTVPYAVGDMAESVADTLFPADKAPTNSPRMSERQDKPK